MSDALLYWPETTLPFTWEEAYCVRYCRRKSLSSFPGEVRFYRPEQGLSFSPGKAVFICRDPKLVVPPESWEELLAGLSSSEPGAVVPVYSQSPAPWQQARDLPPYFDFWSFRQAVRFRKGTENPALIPLVRADPGLVGFRGQPVSEVWVRPRALVHRFGNYAAGEPQRLAYLFPPSCREVLDVGCGRGALGKWWRSRASRPRLAGLERAGELAEEARPFYDELWVVPLEEFEAPREFDLIVLADFVEHLEDPWEGVRRCADWLRRGGVLVGAAPNAGHWSILNSLLEDCFEYIPWGLASVGHLRFFTAASLRELLEEAGLRVERLLGKDLPDPPYPVPLLEKFPEKRSLRVFEWHFRARKS